jgi:hypothetical protein
LYLGAIAIVAEKLFFDFKNATVETDVYWTLYIIINSFQVSMNKGFWGFGEIGRAHV